MSSNMNDDNYHDEASSGSIGFFAYLRRKISGICEIFRFERNVLFDSEIEESLEPDSPEKAKYNGYIQVAKFTDVNSSEFTEIAQGILRLVKEFYRKTIIPRTAKIYSFASIVGPSLMGKTQFAFSLARKYKVFYVNFSGKQDQQEVYQAFDSMSSEIISILYDDCSRLRRLRVELDSHVLASPRVFNLKMKIIGFLWYLIEYSMIYDGNTEWFDFYLKPRKFQYSSMSISEYLSKLSNFVCFLAFILILFRKPC